MHDPALLAHRTLGHGPEKVLVFHDWMGSADNYTALHDYLDSARFSYAFADLRGYGGSRALRGDYTSSEAAADGFALADHLGWQTFNVIGHSMSGMVVQRMLLQDSERAKSGIARIRRALAITPVSADGYPADAPTKEFLWGCIGNEAMSQIAFGLLTGNRLGAGWAKTKTSRHLASAEPDALKGYYRMWLEENFSAALAAAHINTPLRVIGGRQDLPGFQEEHLRATFGQWFRDVDFQFITDCGHYPMQETPALLANLVEGFLADDSAAQP